MQYFIYVNAFGITTIMRRGDDGIEWWLGEGEQDAGYLAWLAEGNTPEPWNPTPAPEEVTPEGE